MEAYSLADHPFLNHSLQDEGVSWADGGPL